MLSEKTYTVTSLILGLFALIAFLTTYNIQALFFLLVIIVAYVWGYFIRKKANPSGKAKFTLKDKKRYKLYRTLFVIVFVASIAGLIIQNEITSFIYLSLLSLIMIIVISITLNNINKKR